MYKKAGQNEKYSYRKSFNQIASWLEITGNAFVKRDIRLKGESLKR